MRGWYRRDPAPVIELRTLIPTGARPIRASFWIGSYALALAATGVPGTR